MKKFVFVAVMIIGVFLFSISGCVEQEPEDQYEKNQTLAVSGYSIGEISDSPKLKMASFYSRDALEIDLKIPEYTLPLDLSLIQNYEDVKSKLYLSNGQESKIVENGFVVAPYSRKEDDIVDVYENLKDREVPIFVTSDTLLHLYHIQFDDTLKTVEEDEFYDTIKDISKAMMEESMEQYASFDSDVKEAAKRNAAFFGVGLKLLDPAAEIPSLVSAVVDAEILKIEEHEGFSPTPIFNTDTMCGCLVPNCYCEDYSQYVPRGHYTRSEKLKKYFKGMMWYGRMTFLLKEGVVTPEDAKIATIQATLISASMDNVKVEGKTVNEHWERIYAVTSFFVGLADDLTPYEYRDVMLDVFGQDVTQDNLVDEQKMLEFRAELAQLRLPKIYGGTGICVLNPPFSPEQINECFDKTQGMRFMGQRFVPDSYMFQNLVFPVAGGPTESDMPFTKCLTQGGPQRCFPRGLDVFAALGSDRALEILESEGDTAYANYTQSMNSLRAEFGAFDEGDWNRNLYLGWLYSLKGLTKEFGPGYQTFMQTTSWQDKELNAVLASWAELRHDTILYVKQSYTPVATGMPPQPKPVVGYVEPVPEFYNRLLSLTKMTRTGLEGMDVLNDEAKQRLLSLESVLGRLIQISEDELENRELTEDDYEFIRNFGENVENTVLGVEFEGTRTTMVADVHTDTNTGKVLEEGTGYVDLIVVAYKLPDNRILVGAGPVMSYYEFKHPMDDRLTDEKWIQMLENGLEPGKPGFTNTFFSE